MKIRNHLVTLIALAVLCSTSAVGAESATHTASTELKWMETPIGAFVSPLAGDMNASEHITYIRFSAGMQTPVHTHTHAYVGIVVTGTTQHWIPGKPETRKDLAPGSHWSIPAGQPHVSECKAGMDCIMAVVQEGAFDFLPQPTGSAN